MKYIPWIIVALLVVGILTYTLGGEGFLYGLLGLAGAGGTKAMADLKAKGAVLDEKADALKEDLKEIEKEKENLEVDDKTPEEEVDYWRKQ